MVDGAIAIDPSGSCRLDLRRGVLLREEAVVPLRPRAYHLLAYLAAHSQRVVAKDELIAAVWKRNAVTDDALMQTIRAIRLAIGDAHGTVLRAVPKRGYILTAGNPLLSPPAAADAVPAPSGSIVPTLSLRHGPARAADGEACADRLARHLLRTRTVQVLQAGSADRADYHLQLDCIGPRSSGSILLRLTERASLATVWGRRVRRAGTTLPVARIATEIERAVAAARRAAVSHGFVAPTAYDHWARGQEMVNRRDWRPEIDREAMACFERSLALDADFARAHAAIALMLNAGTLTRPGLPTEDADRARAWTHARRAVECDPADPRAHLSVAWVALFLHDLPRAKRHFRLALSLNPDAADGLMHNALAEAYFGDAARGLVLARRAKSIEPAYPDYFYYFEAQIHVLAGNYATALAIGSSVEEIAPEHPGWLCAAAGLADRAAEARRLRDLFLRRVGQVWAGREPLTPGRATDWFVAINAALSPDDLARVLRGLASAGLEPSVRARRESEPPRSPG